MSLMQLFLRLMLDPSRPVRRGKDERGFTLTELMVVIFIIGLLATVVAINVLGAQDKAMVTKAKADISQIEQSLENYKLDNLTYPSTTDGLNALVTAPPALAQPERYRRGGYIKKLPSDPWGRPYNYQAPAANGKAFDVWSMGADGAPGGTDDNADIHGEN
ncbi:type II secretion system major pseudopilin GspG [Sphingopyxis sp. DBS4]|uniref:type II secretion system major pseudopilin GspG n=1 Tax=Sphingopyxis sp. DBS4 TaxID=2968500 RepID=UPI0035A6B5CF